MNHKLQWKTPLEQDIDRFLSEFDDGRGVKLTKKEIMKAMVAWTLQEEKHWLSEYIWNRQMKLDLQKAHREAMLARCEEAKGRLHYGA